MAADDHDRILEYEPHEILDDVGLVFDVDEYYYKQRSLHYDTTPYTIKILPYYHGVLSPKNAASMVHEVGDFVVHRMHRYKYDGVVMITVRSDKNEVPGVIHIPIGIHNHDKLEIDENTFLTLGEMIEQYIENKKPITRKKPLTSVLRTPITRQSWMMLHNDIRLFECVGRGKYGEVYRGHVKLGAQRYLQCAIKKHISIDSETTENEYENFMAESKVNRKLEHENIVKFRGIACDISPVFLILEWCENGSLHDYLVEVKSTITYATRLRFSLEAVNGMEYLARNGVIHRELDDENCMLDHKFTLKIGDFGHSKFADQHQTLSHDMLTSFSAPETLSLLYFTQKTDVWAYGLLVAAIFCKGVTPDIRKRLPRTPDEEYINSAKFQQPWAMPDPIFNVIALCFELDPDMRPNFDELAILVRQTARDREHWEETKQRLDRERKIRRLREETPHFTYRYGSCTVSGFDDDIYPC